MLFPGLIVVGAALVAIGMVREARRRRLGRGAPPRPSIDLNDPRVRRRLLFVGLGATGALMVLAYSGYNAFLLSESVAFCGKTCHTPMGPELTAYEHSPHARVPCVDCHVGGGAGAYVHSKAKGVGQLLSVLTDSYPRPIPTPLSDLRPARETCQRCHWPQKPWGVELYRRPHFRYDEASTPEQISMLIDVGGGGGGAGEPGAGIHWHMKLANRVTFAAEDDALQDIPWVRVERSDGSATEYLRSDRRIDRAALARLPRHVMDCMDCHNRPAHDFDPPARRREAPAGPVLRVPRGRSPSEDRVQRLPRRLRLAVS